VDFATLESRSNDFVIKHLSNKTLVIDGVAIDGIFDDRYVEAAFVSSSNPTFTCKTADITTDITRDAEAVDGLTTYEVAETQPDGAGLTKIELRLK